MSGRCQSPCLGPEPCEKRLDVMWLPHIDRQWLQLQVIGTNGRGDVVTTTMALTPSYCQVPLGRVGSCPS